MTNPHQIVLSRPIVLIGMMGAGKTSVGMLLAKHLGLPFVDSDTEIEKAANMSVSDIFKNLGEPAFRDGERKVIARLLGQELSVISTGGGAFMNDQTRSLIKEKAISIWLKASFNILFERVSRNNNRPLLKQGDPATILRNLLDVREPIYGLADLTVLSEDLPLDQMVIRVAHTLSQYKEINGTQKA